MKLSYKWLNEFIDLSDINPEVLAEKLTLAGFEVEEVKPLIEVSNLVVGEVLEVLDHPNSEHLKVCQVNLGDKVEQIVCGAQNVESKQKVIVAKVGAKLPQLEIKETVIRDVASNGMICSLTELGIDEKYLSTKQLEGIEVLADDTKVGSSDILDIIGFNDTILDIDVTVNRSDTLAMFNFVKEIGAILEKDVKDIEINDHSEGLKSDVNVEIKTDKSKMLAAKLINNITIKPSVSWMKEVLIANNITPINNVVDISNIVMLELGQPLHFYDPKKLEKLELVIADGYSEKYTALDEEEYQLVKDDILITSNDKIVGIGGIMGGENSKISDDTTSVLIESAHFNHANIRRSANRLNINSEASARFSKEIDPNALLLAINRATDLLIKYADATEIYETKVIGELDFVKKEVVTTKGFINNLLGSDLNNQEIIDYLNRLNFNAQLKDDKIYTEIPTYRQDIVEEVDLSEEVVRLYGVNNLKTTLPKVEMTLNQPLASDTMRDKIHTLMNGMGFYEIVTYSLVSKKHIENSLIASDNIVEMANPLSNERRYYRVSLIPSLLDTLSYNKARSNHDYMFYELSNTYTNDNQQIEKLSFALSLAQKQSLWKLEKLDRNFFLAKSYVETLLHKLKIDLDKIEYKENDINTKLFHPYQSSAIYLDDKLLGVFGLLYPDTLKEYDIDQSVVGEIDLEVVYASKKVKTYYSDIIRYPGISRDITINVKADLASSKLTNLVKSLDNQLIKNVEIIDLYEGSSIEEGYKSITMRIFYQANDRTLKENEISKLNQIIIDKMILDYQAIYKEK